MGYMGYKQTLSLPLYDFTSLGHGTTAFTGYKRTYSANVFDRVEKLVPLNAEDYICYVWCGI